ncbi:conserved hypothetical protein [Planktothrix agardhii]|uniref:hypothetical protein n=1 Tax=Planktothrix agardhii TaxID=1160 RepID=UPI001B8F8F20|nr:hypothetical protein [Planktothrix agardhii]CAD0224316.1 conserved hypothetical protein [Planktothrix agardhii]
MTTTYESPKTTFNNHNSINDFDANSERRLIQKYRVLSRVSRFIVEQKTQIINSCQLSDFKKSLKYLAELKVIDPDLVEDDEDEVLIPSDYAFSESIKLLFQLYDRLRESFPYCFSDLESRGGVHLIWDDQEFNKKVWVKIPVSSQFQSSVYYRQGEDSELIKNPSFDQVYQLLLWLLNDLSVNDL